MEILTPQQPWPSILLARAGRYDPDANDAFQAARAAGAWGAWEDNAGRMSPDSLIRAVADAGLRGRGGGGFPTGRKWYACATTQSPVHYAVGNGFEADPGAQLDRTLMELDPHAVLEGLAFAAYAVGARIAYLAVKRSYGTALRRLRAALEAARTAGYLGPDVLGRGLELEIEIRELAGSFVVGEETVLLRALENKRAQPDQRPPYPATKGLWDKPTVVNNVETLAAVPWIVANGSSAYAAIGDPSAPGTTLVQISGAVRTPGIAEIPTGTRLREMVEILGGGVTGGRLKAVLVGGPSGGFLPPSALSTAFAAEALEAAGAIVGSGTVVVADERTCLVDLATLMTRYLNDEACGKTIPCRIGLRRLSEIGSRAVTGHARPDDPRLLQDLSADICDSALCGLEYSAPNPLLSGMRYFAEEFEDHVVRSSCAAGVCRPLRVAAGALQ